MNTIHFILFYIFLFRTPSIVKIKRVHKQNNANLFLQRNKTKQWKRQKKWVKCNKQQKQLFGSVFNQSKRQSTRFSLFILSKHWKHLFSIFVIYFIGPMSDNLILDFLKLLCAMHLFYSCEIFCSPHLLTFYVLCVEFRVFASFSSSFLSHLDHSSFAVIFLICEALPLSYAPRWSVYCLRKWSSS